MSFNFKPIVILMAFSLLLSCSQKEQATEVAQKPNIKIPRECKKPAQVLDIWKLEPMLIKSGKIQENMVKAEKETIIREYIRKKNEQYRICTK